jgi:hypothetical protein
LGTMWKTKVVSACFEPLGEGYVIPHSGWTVSRPRFLLSIRIGKAFLWISLFGNCNSEGEATTFSTGSTAMHRWSHCLMVWTLCIRSGSF